MSSFKPGDVMSPCGALAMDVLSSTAIIHCKKYHEMHTRAFMSESYQTHCVCKHFNIKTSKTQCFLQKNCKFLPGRSCGNHKKTIGILRILSNPAISCHRAVHSRCSVMHPGRESCAKNTTRATCARVAASACPNPSRVVAIIGTVAGLAVVVAIIAGHRPPWASLGCPVSPSGFLGPPQASCGFLGHLRFVLKCPRGVEHALGSSRR